ncbi:MAG TPA: hypothetical protein VMV70_02375 [Gallionella sp.]|nr:hypothetical protein [Gallionella sp.]
MQAIVGVEIPIERLVGKWKVSQNRPEADKLGIVAELMSRNDMQDKEMALMVNQHVSIVTDG